MWEEIWHSPRAPGSLQMPLSVLSASALDFRLLCFQPESVPFWPVFSQLQLSTEPLPPPIVLDCEHMSGLEEWWVLLETILLLGQTRLSTWAL